MSGCGGTWAEAWPVPDWQTNLLPRTAVLEDFETYSFPARRPLERSGIRTDALLVVYTQWPGSV